MKLDAKGRVFIQAREALRLTAYPDVKGVPTIGYGTTVYPGGKSVKIGDKCTKQQAEDYFTHDSIEFENAVNDHVLTISLLTQNQFNALVSLTYNIGENGFADSTICKVVNSAKRNDVNVVSDAFLRWIKIRKDGKLIVVDGLVTRRKKEIELYFS